MLCDQTEMTGDVIWFAPHWISDLHTFNIFTGRYKLHLYEGLYKLMTSREIISKSEQMHVHAI